METEKLLGHYRILERLGAGGMGEVFLAADTKLDRKVAVKFLKEKFAEDADKLRRFIQEAKASSAFNHPNILTVYEIGEADGTHFIAAEFIDGKTLGDYAKAIPLNYKAVLEIAIQVASALDEAHSAGIVHRDIKPDSIIVRANGLVKILDFGIAKLTEVNPAVNMSSEDVTVIKPESTNPGTIIGTASYMSPEQAKGKTVDARSDIFSFGVVLYQMISRRLPFEGGTATEMIGAILHKEPKPLDLDVPTEIARIVNKCLQKDRDERYQTIADVCTELKEFKQELEFQEKLERTTAPNRKEAETQIFKAKTTAEALDLADKMIEIEPDFYGAYWFRGAIHLSAGEYKKAVEELKKAVTLGGHQIVLSDLASAHSLAGDADEAAAILERLLEMRRDEYAPAICLARIYSRLGENDKTIEWLEKAFEERNGEMVFLQSEIAGAADGDSLHSLADDPRLTQILNKMNLP